MRIGARPRYFAIYLSSSSQIKVSAGRSSPLLVGQPLRAADAASDMEAVEPSRPGDQLAVTRGHWSRAGLPRPSSPPSVRRETARGWAAVGSFDPPAGPLIARTLSAGCRTTGDLAATISRLRRVRPAVKDPRGSMRLLDPKAPRSSALIAIASPEGEDALSASTRARCPPVTGDQVYGR
jgi:hypothetical protein